MICASSDSLHSMRGRMKVVHSLLPDFGPSNYATNYIVREFVLQVLLGVLLGLRSGENMAAVIFSPFLAGGPIYVLRTELLTVVGRSCCRLINDV